MNSFITIENQNLITIKGTTKVLSSTQNQAVIECGETTICLSGSELEVKKLDLENKEVSFSGKINQIKFTSKTEKTPFLKRVFK